MRFVANQAVVRRVVPCGKTRPIARLCRGAKAFARSVGMSARPTEELAIAVAELASNVARHAHEGVLELHHREQPRPHVEAICWDRGPGIADIDQAKRDGVSRGQTLLPDSHPSEGLGLGLGAIERLVDEVVIESTLGIGTTVTLRKWIR
ncbi:MAG: anti-sigma regulatory factor [Deltaproteobacteria bacterium]|nr:anti-sigma regulatory factor [Deltaproteobacteria bacterium]